MKSDIETVADFAVKVMVAILWIDWLERMLA